MTSMKTVQFSRSPTPLVHLLPKFFHSLDLGRRISNEPPPLQIITNQLKDNIIQGWLLYVIRSFLQVGFRFQSQLINLVCLSFDFFSFSWEASLSAFLWLSTLVCAVVQKYHEMSFIYNYSHFYYSFRNQPVLIAQLENLNKQWNNNYTVHVNKRSQNKNKTKSCHIEIDNAFYLAHKQCNGIIKGWLYCLTSESKGRFLVNMLMFGSA